MRFALLVVRTLTHWTPDVSLGIDGVGSTLPDKRVGGPITVVEPSEAVPTREGAK
jgi:hypothetical protein